MSHADKIKSFLTLLMSTVIVGVLFYITFAMMPSFFHVETTPAERSMKHDPLSTRSGV